MAASAGPGDTTPAAPSPPPLVGPVYSIGGDSLSSCLSPTFSADDEPDAKNVHATAMKTIGHFIVFVFVRPRQ